MKAASLLFLGALAVLPVAAQAAEPARCQLVRMSDPGWTDIQSTTAIANTLLKGLGYKTKVTLLGVPLTYKALAEGKNMDVFLGTWIPTMEPDLKPYRDAGRIDIVRVNLKHAKYTLAVPEELWNRGLKDFADIPKFKDELNGKIYGLEPGDGGNNAVLKAIEQNAFGLKDAGFNVVASSESGMLSQVDRAIRRKNAILFLGWEPHPMNTRFRIRFLTGGDAFFGPDFGDATVYTSTRKGYVDECPNVGQLLKNLSFTLDMENTIMGSILDDKMEPEDAAKAWLKKNPQVLEPWLKDVATVDGRPGLEVVRGSL
ncbi:choline ABC transporter substrate-binding protein [Pseudomonas citronellolis]|uniref:choline ABC transporter substrate-binding protein n=1 Tax=Pseudomonas citronellolis TaxID=53408 RepID=UPI0020A10165|nr:choline ABC transporter substrate-binding protein [Pseudomonas citronellolis]MCP1607449.1 glycine betaine/proline transport system substrate-binding protein [Pseudomonas citronellolis]MCP1658383.1 glycine betaine/proline transport system substrate-binding protein [Pseudomonas citronellolis]MCP1725252.1 glycine betaine/proline transport system substrate-binding protein [Pseudomonas citronellolis]